MTIETDIRELASRYAANLKARVDGRVTEMEGDDNSHYLIYRVLGVMADEGKLIDVHQNNRGFGKLSKHFTLVWIILGSTATKALTAY